MNLLTLLFSTLLSISLVLAGTPGALRSLSGRDYSHLLKRSDEPVPARLSNAQRASIAIPRTLQLPATPVRRSSPAGALVAARQLTCDQGYTACSDGNGGCCPTGAECCQQVAMCCSGGTCCGGSCCDNNGVCCGSAGCCDQGNTCQTVNGFTGCCAAGQTCDAFTGCSNSSLVECSDPQFPFCCPAGETCGRDSAGNATCNGQDTVQGATSSLAAPSPGNTSVSVPGSTASSSSRQSSSSSSSTSQSTATGTRTTPVSSASSSSSSSTGAGVAVTVPQGSVVLGLLAVVVAFL